MCTGYCRSYTECRQISRHPYIVCFVFCHSHVIRAGNNWYTTYQWLEPTCDILCTQATSARLLLRYNRGSCFRVACCVITHHQMSKDTILAVNVVCVITASIQRACSRHKQDAAVPNDCIKQFTSFTGSRKSIQHVSIVDAVHMHAVLTTNLHCYLHNRHACAYCCHHCLECHLHSCNCTLGMNLTHLG